MSEAAIYPPEQLLTKPQEGADEDSGGWLVVARNSRVNRNWEALIERSPESALRWYKYLRNSATTRYPSRVFPLRGSVYRGAWECEIAGGDRVFYVPDEAVKKVVVY
jgi:hypothetical protein